MSKFCVILITHNNEGHVAKALAAIKAQTVGGWSCLLVDNGSTDQTVTRAENAVRGDARFSIHPKANEGPSAGRNFGYRFVRDDCAYIAFIDGDDWIREDFLDVMGEYLDAHPEVGLVTCRHAKVNSDGGALGPGPANRYVPGTLGFPRRLRADEPNTPFVTFFSVSGQGPFALYRRSVFAQTTGYEPAFSSHEDTDVFCQMALLAEVHALPDELYFKREHSSNLTKVGNRNPFARSCYDAFRKKWDTMEFTDARKQLMLEEARAYYYTRHVPCRHLIVMGYGIRELREKRDVNHFRWMGMLFYEAIKGFFFGRRNVRTARAS